MGRFISGPAQGKAEFILSDIGGRRTNIEEILCTHNFKDNNILVCVIQNSEFDAAKVIESDDELSLFAYDSRPKTWLLVDKSELKQEHYV
jgi:hypothetical protein